MFLNLGVGLINRSDLARAVDDRIRVRTQCYVFRQRGEQHKRAGPESAGLKELNVPTAGLKHRQRSGQGAGGWAARVVIGNSHADILTLKRHRCEHKESPWVARSLLLQKSVSARRAGAPSAPGGNLSTTLRSCPPPRRCHHRMRHGGTALTGSTRRSVCLTARSSINRRLQPWRRPDADCTRAQLCVCCHRMYPPRLSISLQIVEELEVQFGDRTLGRI